LVYHNIRFTKQAIGNCQNTNLMLNCSLVHTYKRKYNASTNRNMVHTKGATRGAKGAEAFPPPLY